MSAAGAKIRVIGATWIQLALPEAVCAEGSHLWRAIEAIGALPGVRVSSNDEGTVVFVDAPSNVQGCDAWETFNSEVHQRTGLRASESFPARTGGTLAVAFTRPLYPHQQHAVDFLVERGRGLLADDMGLGKSSTAAVTAAQLRGAGGRVLIIGPKSTRAVWRGELSALGILRDERDFLGVEGTETPDGFWDQARAATFWFVHYELVSAWLPRLLVNPVGKPTVVILDEMHWLRNPKSQRSAAVLAGIARIPRRIGLTGTPVANRPSELWALLTAIEGTGSWGSQYDFRRRYCGAWTGDYGLVDGEPSHTDELRQRLQNVYMRRTQADAGIELPEIQRTVHMVELDGGFKHRSTTDDELARVTAALERGSFGPDTLQVMSRLSKETSKAKLATTVEVLEDMLEQGEAAVVFVHERQTAEAIVKRLPRGAGVYVHGGLNQTDRDDIVRRFQMPDGPPCVLVATYGALREGVTLHRARNIILHDLTWVPGDVLQAEKRVHRIGQKRSVLSRWMVLPRSFDSLLAAHLHRKGRAIAASVGDTQPQAAFASSGLSGMVDEGLEAEVQRFLNALDGDAR